MCKQTILLILSLFVFTMILSAQTISLDLPSCYHLQYVLALKQGTKLDTVSVGRFDEKGKATFTLPDKYASYRGVGNLSVPTTTKKVNIIINGEEKISVKEIDTDSDDVIFSNSKENIALVDMMTKQKGIIENYNKQGSLGLGFSYNPAAHEYTTFYKEIKESSLYAARMMELLNSLSGLGSKLGLSEETISLEQKQYISEELNLKDLYTSGFWQLMLETWFQTFLSDDTLLLDSSRKLLEKTEDVIVRRELTNSIIQLFSKYGRDNLLMELGSEYLTIPINGKPAPELITGGAPIQPKSCLIFFYDSDCGMCHNELHQLIEKYEFLSNDHNQIEVIAISADTNKDDFDYTAAKMPWKNKLYDPKGFAGENFANYGIVGTPTIILVDKEGIVRGRYARLSEFLKD